VEERLEQEEHVEVGQVFGFGGKAPEPSPVPIDADPAASDLTPSVITDQYHEGLEKAQRTEAFQALIARLLAGTEPLSRPLWGQEPKKFNAGHIQLVMLRVAGFKAFEIAQMTGMHKQYVATILRHPYAVRLMQELLPSIASAALDMQATLETYSKSIIHKLGRIALETSDDKVAARVGFGILDRAGYTPVSRAVTKHEHRIRGDSGQIDRLTKAMELSRQAREVPAQFTVAKTVKKEEGTVSPTDVEDSDELADEVSGSIPPSQGASSSQSSPISEAVA
jgi:hypothetical protein